MSAFFSQPGFRFKTENGSKLKKITALIDTMQPVVKTILEIESQQKSKTNKKFWDIDISSFKCRN